MNLSKKTVSLPIVIVLVLIVGGASFFAGSRLNRNRAFTARNGQLMKVGNRIGQGQGMTGSNNRRNAAGMQMVNGEIIAADDVSLTVKTVDGSSQIVLLSSSTAYKKMSDASKSDLTVGTKVNITGNKDNSGSLTAAQISTGVNMSSAGPQDEILQGNNRNPALQK